MILLNGTEIKPTKNFPNGERIFNYDSFQLYRSNPNFVELKFDSMEDLINLYFMMNLMPKDFQYILISKYIPFSRFDYDNNEDLFMLKACAKLINDMNFIEVWIDEPQSKVILSLIDRVIPAYSNKDILDNLVKEGKVISPRVLIDWNNIALYKNLYKDYDVAYVTVDKNEKGEDATAFTSFVDYNDDTKDLVLIVPYLGTDDSDKFISMVSALSNMTQNKITIIAGAADTSLTELEGKIKIYTKNYLGSCFNNDTVEIVTISKDAESD